MTKAHKPPTFLHAIDLENPIVCYQIFATGKIYAPETVVAMTPEFAELKANSVRTTPLDVLRNHFDLNIPVTPLAGERLTAAAMIRCGYKLGIGDPIHTWLKDDEMNTIIEQSELELQLERVRREVCPHAASRLCCLWVVPNRPENEILLQKMLGEHITILRVTIPIIQRFSMADAHWLVRYCYEQREEFLKSYWKLESTESPVWECLVEGVLEVSEEDRKLVAEKGSHLRKLKAKT